jgi:hypothetical protein
MATSTKIDIRELGDILSRIMVPPQEAPKKNMGTVVENPSEVDYGNLLATFMNKEKAKGRPVVARAEDTVKGGAKSGLAGALGDLVSGPQEAAGVGDNPLKQYLMSLKRMATDAALKVTGQPRSLEDQLLQFLEANKNNPARNFSEASPEFDPFGRQPLPKKGLAKYVGDISTMNERGQSIAPQLGGKKYYIDAAGQLLAR